MMWLRWMLLFSAFFGFTSASQAQWTTDQTLKAVVWSYDKDCVELKLNDGQKMRFQKTALNLKKIEPQKTVVEFHLDVLEKYLCAK